MGGDVALPPGSGWTPAPAPEPIPERRFRCPRCLVIWRDGQLRFRPTKPGSNTCPACDNQECEEIKT